MIAKPSKGPNPRSAPKRPRLPSPIGGKTHSMPTYHRLRSNDGCGIKNARETTIEPDEQGAIGPTQMQPTWCALPEHIELMPQHQDFGFQPPSRLEAVAQPPGSQPIRPSRYCVARRAGTVRPQAGRWPRRRRQRGRGKHCNDRPRHKQGEVSPLNTGFALLRCMSPVMALNGG